MAHPNLDPNRTSLLTEAMDIARGRHFNTVPTTYPPSAWYHYTDVTCEYRCQGPNILLGADNTPGSARRPASGTLSGYRTRVGTVHQGQAASHRHDAIRAAHESRIQPPDAAT